MHFVYCIKHLIHHGITRHETFYPHLSSFSPLHVACFKNLKNIWQFILKSFCFIEEWVFDIVILFTIVHIHHPQVWFILLSSDCGISLPLPPPLLYHPVDTYKVVSLVAYHRNYLLCSPSGVSYVFIHCNSSLHTKNYLQNNPWFPALSRGDPLLPLGLTPLPPL